MSTIKRVSVNRNPYTAEFGRPGRGRVEVFTRAGTYRRYRGNFVVLLGHSALDARNAFAEVQPLQQRIIPEAGFNGPLCGVRTWPPW